MLLIVRGPIGVHLAMIRGMSPPSDILERFGNRVRKLRKQQGWSQEEFAHQCGLDRTYVGGIERGERNPALRNIERIALSLNVTISQLMKDV